MLNKKEIILILIGGTIAFIIAEILKIHFGAIMYIVGLIFGYLIAENKESE